MLFSAFFHIAYNCLYQADSAFSFLQYDQFEPGRYSHDILQLNKYAFSLFAGYAIIIAQSKRLTRFNSMEEF